MRLLFDQNLSRFFVDRLSDEFPDSAHVVVLGLDRATDREILDYAAEHDFVIVSKDSDFRQLAILRGPPPKSVWLHVGNASTDVIHELLQHRLVAMREFEQSKDQALLVIAAAEKFE